MFYLYIYYNINKNFIQIKPLNGDWRFVPIHIKL